jgi:hypothetical protein
MARKIGELFFELRTSTEALSRDLKEGERQLGKFTEFVKANPLVAVTGLGAAFAGVAFAAAQAAAKIDLTFRQVTNTLGATAKEAAALREDLRAVSIESGKSREEIAGLFRAIAEGGPNGARNVRAIADAAIALSDVLGGDVGANASGLDQITDIFAIDPARAKEVAAALFTIASGKVPLNDVFDALSKIGPEAAALGLSFEQVASFLTRFLDQGYSVKRVSALFKELADNGAEGRKEILALAGSTENTADAMAKLEKAQADVTASGEKQFEVLKNRLSDQWLEFGSKVLPPVTTALRLLNDILDGTSAKLVGVGDGSDRAMAGLLRVAEQQRKVTIGEVAFRSNGGGNAEVKASVIGDRYAEIVSATKKLEQLSIKALRENQQRLNDILNTPGINDSLEQKAKALQAKIGEAIEAAYKKSREKVEKADAELRRSLKDIGEDIDRVMNRVFADEDDRRAETIRDLQKESAERQKNADQTSEQITALMQSKEAYEAALVTQAKSNAVESARQRLLKVGLDLSPDQVKAIEAETEANIRLEKVKSALLAAAGVKPQEIKQTVAEVGQLADALSLAAGAAAGIATAFGEAGRRIAAVLGSTSQLLTALSRAQGAGQFTDGKGVKQNVGFLGALSGKAGAAGIGTAAASALSFVGAAAQIADAVDLFGNRAREQARLLRERAIAFNQALEDFAISNRSDLEEQLRQNLRKANELAASAGLQGVNFQSTSEIGQTVETLRALSRELSDSKNIKNILQIADALSRLGKEAAENEVKLRAANASAIARLREDLDIRRIALTQGNDAATAARAQLELERQIAEIRDRYGDAADGYIADLVAIAAAETQLAAARAAQAAVLRRIEDDDALLGGGVYQSLQRSIAGFVESFGGQVVNMFNGLDLNTADGLNAAKQKIRDLYQQLAADGIDENERPIIDFLKRIFGQLDEAIGTLPDGFANVQAQLDAFDEWVQLFASGGKDLGTQIRQLGVILGGQFNGALDDILKNADLGSATGRAQFKNQIETLLAGVLADGKIDEKEGPLYAVLQRLLGIANQALTDAETEADRIAEAARQKRQQRRSSAQTRIELFDLAGLDAFRVTLEGLGPAFASLFGDFDLSSLKGIEDAKGVIRGIFTELESLSDEEIFQKFGLTRDELVAALLDADNGLDGLQGSLKDVAAAAIEAARASAEFTDEISQDFLRSQGRGQEADINAAKAKRDERLKKAAQLGLGPDVLAQIEAIFQADLIEIANRYAPAVTAAVDSVASVGTSSVTSQRGSGSRGTRTSSLVQDFGGLTEITAQSLAALQREAVLYAAETARATSGMLAILSGGLPSPPSSLLRFASGGGLPTATTGAGGVMIGTIIVNIGSLNPMGMTPGEAASSTARELSRQFGKLISQEANFLGTSVA